MHWATMVLSSQLPGRLYAMDKNSKCLTLISNFYQSNRSHSAALQGSSVGSRNIVPCLLAVLRTYREGNFKAKLASQDTDTPNTNRKLCILVMQREGRSALLNCGSYFKGNSASSNNLEMRSVENTV